MITILKNTWAVLDQKEKKKFTILTLFDIFISILDISFLALLLWIVQFYIQPGSNKQINFLPDWLANKNSIAFISIFFILFGIKNLAGYFITRAQYKFISSVAIRISANNLANYQQASFEEFINIDSSVHIRRIGFQPFEFCQFMLAGIQQIITQFCLIAVTITAIVLFNAKLFLLLLIILLPPVIVVFYFIKKRLTAYKKNIQVSNERSFQHLLDALKGYVESNIYNRNDFFMKRFIRHRSHFSNVLFDSMAMQSLPTRIIEIFAVLGLFILIAIAEWSGNNDNATLITIGAFMAAAYKIIPGIVKVVNISGQIKAFEFSENDLKTNRKTKPQVESSGEEISSLQLKNVSFHYPDQPVLKDFCLTINKGEFAGITGQSGKGKTTILNLILGFLPVAGGEVIINNRSVNKDEIKKYWPLISYVRQQPFFIYDTILRNITLEEEVHDKKKLQCAMSISGIDKLLEKFPEGMDKLITENGKNISGGQQQRIAIARALYKNADLILLDEPFNELDEESCILLLKHFRQSAGQGKIIIMITHDKQSLSYCDKIISLDEQ